MSEQPPIETAVQECNRIGRDEVARLAAELRAGGDGAWQAPAYCAGWTARDAVCHLVVALTFLGHATRAALSGQPPLTYDAAPAEALNAQLQQQSREQVLAELERAQQDYAEYLDSLDVAALAFPVTVPWGTHPVWRIALAALNEIVIHAWDVRAGQNADARLNADAVPLLADLAAGGAALLAQGPKSEGTWQLEVDGRAGRPLALRVEGDRVTAESGPAQQAAIRLTLDGEAFVRLLWGRLDLAQAIDTGRVRVDGDRERALALQRLFCGV